MNINIALEDDAPPTSITCSPEEDALLDGDDDTGTGLEEEEASQGARQKQARPMTETTKQAVEGIHHRKLILEQMVRQAPAPCSNTCDAPATATHANDCCKVVNDIAWHSGTIPDHLH